MLRRAVLFVLLSFALAITAPLFASAYDAIAAAADAANSNPCTISGTRPATASDAAVQEGQITAGTCYNPNDPTIGANADQAKQDLSGMVCRGGADIEHLDAKFAVCADKFMKLLRNSAPSACIGSAYRSPQAQLAACMGICGASSCPGKCAPPGASYHQKGLAIDVNDYNNNNQLLWQTGAQVGIYNPPGLHSSDAHHMQSQPNSVCAGIPVPAGDQGDYYNDTNRFFPPPPSPPFDNQLRSVLPTSPALPVQQPLQTTPVTSNTSVTPVPVTASSTPPAIGTGVNTTPYPAGTCNPQTYCSQSDGNIYYRATTCVDQVYQWCSSGCTGLICNASSTSATDSNLSGLLTPDTSNQNSNSNTNSNGTSTFDLIDYFANNSITATDIGTATPIDVSQLLQDAGANQASTLQPTQSGPPIQTPPQGSVGYGPVPQQTFTSPDLANSPGYYAGQSSTFENALAGMKVTLLGILNYLQPFGGRIQTSQFSE